MFVSVHIPSIYLSESIYLFTLVYPLQGPCPPKNLTLVRECFSNIISFSWEHTESTDFYLAKAVDSQVLLFTINCLQLVLSILNLFDQ